jgi:ornithine cyclodeaminase/alanine dehydrogenase-like protein (mu-crystallin family)
VRILRDLDLQGLVDIPKVVERIEAGYRADARGDVVPFPRSRVDARGVSLAWQGAAIPSQDLFGYRSYAYNAEGYDRGEQVVALYGYTSMDVRALFVGRLVGNLRTGAALAAALHLAEPGVQEVGLIGTGDQARNALACIASTLRPSRVIAWSPTLARREEFRAWADRVLGLRVELGQDAAEVIRSVPAIVLVTSAENTVVTSEMVTQPKLLLSISAYRRPEIDVRLLDSAFRVWTDSVVQASGPGTLFEPDTRRVKLRPLGEGIADGSARDQTSTRIIINTGAAWEELALAEMMYELAESRNVGLSVELPKERPGAAVF